MRARFIFDRPRIRQQIRSSAEIHRSQVTTQRLTVGATILVVLIATHVPWAFGQQVSVAAEGAGGAVGPSILTFGDLPSAPTAQAQSLVPPRTRDKCASP